MRAMNEAHNEERHFFQCVHDLAMLKRTNGPEIMVMDLIDELDLLVAMTGSDAIRTRASAIVASYGARRALLLGA